MAAPEAHRVAADPCAVPADRGSRRVPPGKQPLGSAAGAAATQLRHRALPAQVMAYSSMGMALYADGSYEHVCPAHGQAVAGVGVGRVFHAAVEVSDFPCHGPSGIRAGPGSVGAGRTPFGYARDSGIVAGRASSDGDRRAMSDLTDTTPNTEFFGRPASSRGEWSALTQDRLVAPAECGTHATVGPRGVPEIELSRELVGRLKPGMLVLADRGLYGFRLWQYASASSMTTRGSACCGSSVKAAGRW
ncbi:transposase domain-containing protein [Streptomyces sp. NPDC056930]|uniref:transposase domain-containing protein n=1 Tax=Streptomyces sp. NPDC056930 TaxID=3345967 RepID=UPI00364529BB